MNMQLQRQPQPPDRGLLTLWPIRAALGVSFLAAGLGLIGLTLLALSLLPSTASLHDRIGVLQLVFASVAGAGALVALVVAYRRQKVAEADSAHDRTRVFNERFTAIAAQLGDDQPAVRLAGVHAMAGLADDWEANRQTCVDVLCAYLRIPYEPDPGEDAPLSGRVAFRAIREVRHTVIRVITAHLQDGAAVSWQGLDFDFTGVVFDGGSFAGARFSDGTVDFTDARFSGGTVDFMRAQFSGGTVNFGVAEFADGMVDFRNAKFSGSEIIFGVADFSGGTVDFVGAKFSGGTVYFGDARFSGGTIDFGRAEFSGGTVYFSKAKFSGATIVFNNAKFSGGIVDFDGAMFSGGTIAFNGAEFSGGTADFSGVTKWSNPPRFDSPIPPAVRLPAAHRSGP